MKRTLSTLALVTTAITLSACGSSTADPQQQALATVKAYLESNLADLVDAAQKLQAAAPAPDDDGWNATTDAAALDAMRTQWKRARTYEHVEGAIAVLFPELDVSTDQRYDGFLVDNGPDTNLFDDQNVTGVHAIERILWSNQIPDRVVTFEQTLTGYAPAAFPATRAQADDFKNKLCARFATEVASMRSQFAAVMLDPVAAFRGVIGSMGEQIEKAERAGDGEEESRYAQYTLADMRINVAAGVATFAAFAPWLMSKQGDAEIQSVTAAFARVQAAYGALPGDALPPVPATWDPAQPSTADLQTPYGMLWNVLHTEADAAAGGSLVADMNQAALTLGIPELSP
jgi:iron uptake system component EfeO